MIIPATEKYKEVKMRTRSRMLTISIFGLLILVLSVVNCDAFEGHARSKDDNLVVTYKVEEGYKITIRIDTKRKKAAHLKSFQADVFGIEIDFVDVNGDGLQDVIVKYGDETGYSPAVFINHDDLSFKDALSDIKKKGPLYINEEPDVIQEGGATPRGGYKVKNRDGIPELTFYNVFIGSKGYRYAAFRYDKQTTSYVLYKKGELFEEH